MEAPNRGGCRARPEAAGLEPRRPDGHHQRPGRRDAPPPATRRAWDIRGIVNHIGSAEWWYLNRLGLAFARAELPGEHTERLWKVRACLLEALPTLVGVEKVAGREGELWSLRKMLRRALWHERDHVDHIRGLLAAQD